MNDGCSLLIRKAVAFATKVHEIDVKKKRKGKDVPYITHPLTVGLILSRVTDDENTIAAGILHDTIEDCEPYGSVTKKRIEREFNADVARMVDDLTEQDKSLPWAERKAAAFRHIAKMEHDSLLVKAADVLHNLSELNDDYAVIGDAVFERFNAPKEKTIERYRLLIPEILRAWPENPMNKELLEELNRLNKSIG